MLRFHVNLPRCIYIDFHPEYMKEYFLSSKEVSVVTVSLDGNILLMKRNPAPVDR